jgi:RNA polymerase sigma-70 factor, ECF subfamily
MSDQTQQTKALLDRAATGDESARRDLLERYRDFLRRMVAARLDRRLAARLDPSDIVQETLADASQQLDKYLGNPTVTFFGWLRMLAGNHIQIAHRQHLFAQRRTIHRESRTPGFTDESAAVLVRQSVANDTSPSNRLVRQERSEKVKEALAALSPHDREVLAMRYVEQLSMSEMADALGISEGGVKTRYLRALVRMRAILEPE